MKKTGKYAKRGKRRSAEKGLLCVLFILLVIDVGMLAAGIFLEDHRRTEETVPTVQTDLLTDGFATERAEAFTDETAVPFQEQAQTAVNAATESTQGTVITEPAESMPGETITTEPSDAQRTFLPYLQEYYDKNEDIIGWLKIEGTRLDYPLMYTPEEPEKYLHLNFNENDSYGGLPFLDANCSLSPESDNLIIYGHNMLDGSMFRTLMKYDQKSYWEKHPVIRLDLIDEEREYEIIAAFYDRVYFTYETCFKFYQFINVEDQTHFEEAMTYYRSNSLYDTGVEAQFGGRLITLVTCAYHVDNGRFVVVARESKN